MHAMVCLWLTIYARPFCCRAALSAPMVPCRARAAPDAAFALLQRAHWLLLALSLITILGAVAGSQGMSLL